MSLQECKQFKLSITKKVKTLNECPSRFLFNAAEQEYYDNYLEEAVLLGRVNPEDALRIVKKLKLESV